MGIVQRGIKCLKENGLIYTIKNIRFKIIRWVRGKVIMPNYYDDLRNRVNQYQQRYSSKPRNTAMRLIWWNFKSLFKRHHQNQVKHVGATVKHQSNTTNHIPKYPLKLSSDVLNIGFQINGGLGDFLITANFIFKFREKYGYDHIRIDVFAHNGFSAAQSIFRVGEVIDNLYPEEGYAHQFRDYDIYALVNRYPDIKRRQLNRIAEIAPELLEWLYLCERFRAENSRFFEKRIITDGQSAMLSILDNKKRIQQPDVYGFLGITEKYEYPMKIYTDELCYLQKLNLYNRPFITLHRGCDIRQTKESVKLWPRQYYNILIKQLKDRYPDILLVQLGVSHDRCDDMMGVDINLIGQTTMEELKVLLKHSLIHIDGEGGMVHMRHALSQLPSVVFFGSTSDEFFGYSENLNIRGNGCDTWCEWAVEGWMQTCLRGYEVPPCMASIIPEHVFQQITELIDSKEEEKNG